MQCNINSKGRAVRLIGGLGWVVLAWTLWKFGAGGWVDVLAAGLLLVGFFQIGEGLAGWCVVRAMGFKTRL